jgi:fructosamine-3-kinase
VLLLCKVGAVFKHCLGWQHELAVTNTITAFRSDSAVVHALRDQQRDHTCYPCLLHDKGC